MGGCADEIDLAQCRADQLSDLAVAGIRIGSETGEGREFRLDRDCRMPDQRLPHVHKPPAVRPVRDV